MVIWRSLFDGDGTSWTLSRRPAHLLAKSVRWRLVQNLEHTVIANLEDLRCGVYTVSMEITDVKIHNNLHVSSSWPPRRMPRRRISLSDGLAGSDPEAGCTRVVPLEQTSEGLGLGLAAPGDCPVSLHDIE